VNWFQTGGGPGTVPGVGCLPMIGLGLLSLFAGCGFAAFVVMIAARIWGQG